MDELRKKERSLLKSEIKNLQQALVKKNELINITLESQEKLTMNQATQQQKITETEEKLEKALASTA